MSPIDRRLFVFSAGAFISASMTQSQSVSYGQNDTKTDTAGNDAIALNLQFRQLYKLNRDELLSQVPLSALTLIGTGEVWRIEYGVPVKAYPPIPWIASVKGLMHSVIATQATIARLDRARDLDLAQADAGRLAEALGRAELLIATTFPKELTLPGRAVITTLRGIAERGKNGLAGAVKEFATAMKPVQPQLETVINGVGEAIYESVSRGLRSLAAESDRNDWDRAIVGVCGVGFARRDNIEIAAAMSVMGRETVGTRLLYLENAFTIADGIKQLAASLADRDLGRDVFDDPYRMWRDLLGDVAIKHVGSGFFPELGKPS